MRFAGETWTNPASRAAQSVETAALSPTIQPSDAATIYITGLPPRARVAKKQSGGTLFVSPFSTEDGGMMTTVSQCQQAMAGTMATSYQPRQQPPPSAAATKPRLCICTLAGRPGDMVARSYAKQQARQLGLHTSQGTNIGIYDFPSLRIDLV